MVVVVIVVVVCNLIIFTVVSSISLSPSVSFLSIYYYGDQLIICSSMIKEKELYGSASSFLQWSRSFPPTSRTKRSVTVLVDRTFFTAER